MKNGQYTFYAVQQRTHSKGGWLKPNSPLQPVPAQECEWHCCGNDYWGYSTNPHVGTGNNWIAAHRRADKEWFDCQRATGQHGWFTLKYALAALKRLRKHDSEGHYNYRDTYGKLCQEVRHEFRIVKITLTYQRNIEPLTVDDVVEAAK